MCHVFDVVGERRHSISALQENDLLSPCEVMNSVA